MKCKCKGCAIKTAVFAYTKSDKERFCKKHKLIWMVDVANPQCTYNGCTKQPKFNLPHIKKGDRCSEHATNNMVDVANPQCSFNGCAKQPNFNLPHLKKGLYCIEHKLPKMVDVKNPRCLADGCSKQPSFNLPYLKKGIFCGAHATTDMIELHAKRCEYEGCGTRASYNFKGSKGVKFCSKHAIDGMIELHAKRCEHEGCGTRASYNFKDSIGKRFCSKHAIDGMIELYAKRCEHEGCETKASLNFKDSIGHRFCSKHALPDMISKSNSYCEHEGCGTIASCNYKGKLIHRFCGNHKLTGMISLTNPLCVECDTTSARSHYEDHCYSCFSSKYPDHPRIRNFKIKENAIMSEIAKAYPNIILDKIIQGGSSKKRPDGLIKLAHHATIVEVDENQHKDYDIEYDNDRTIAISRDLNNLPIVFIRVNPDSYKVNGKSVNSAFSIIKKTGTLKTHPKILQNRIKAVLSMIKHHYDLVPSRGITTETLFFDEFKVDELNAQLASMTID